MFKGTWIKLVSQLNYHLNQVVELQTLALKCMIYNILLLHNFCQDATYTFYQEVLFVHFKEVFTQNLYEM